MKRHFARMANTDQRVVVVFMQVPGKEDHALVVSTDNLPPRWEQALMSVADSPEGQGDPDLGNVLGRRMMPDSTETILQALHGAGLLLPVPINNVIMFPEPNRPFALRQILQAMGRIAPDEFAQVDKLNEAAAAKAAPKVSPVGQHKTPVDPFAAPAADTKFNPHTANQSADVSSGDTAIAHGLLMEAEMLEADARAKRERAYQQAPHLRPQVRVPLPEAVAPAPAKAAPKAKKAAEAAPAKPRRAAPSRKKAAG